MVHQYPTTRFQQQRFLNLGWYCARGRTLWDLWSDNNFLNTWQRASLNTIEPFDEWEEFALFASHYFLLVATKYPSSTKSPLGLEWYLKVGQHSSSEDVENYATSHNSQDCSNQLGLWHSDKTPVRRRFGALLQRADETLELHGGFGLQTRATDSQLFTSGHFPLPRSPHKPLPSDMKSRVCHSITRLHTSAHLNLLVGGRASPSEAFSDCWIQRDDGVWRKELSLPKPLYRHSAVSVRLSDFTDDSNTAILIYGGRSTDGKVMNDWYLGLFPRAADGHRGIIQWSHLACEGTTLRPRFGASLMTTSELEGILLGGMSEDGTVLNEMYHWALQKVGTTYVMHVKDRSHILMGSDHIACRVGATVTSDDGLRWMMAGGITDDGIIPDRLQILHLDFTTSQMDIALQWQPIDYTPSSNADRPLFLGHQAVATSEGVVIVGGGANCFSFGTCWSSGLWLLSRDREKIDEWCEVVKEESSETGSIIQRAIVLPASPNASKSVPTVKVACESDFQDIVRAAIPVIIEGLALGSCSAKWTLPYLKEAMGPNRQVGLSHYYDHAINFTTCCNYTCLRYYVAHRFILSDMANFFRNLNKALCVAFQQVTIASKIHSWGDASCTLSLKVNRS